MGFSDTIACTFPGQKRKTKRAWNLNVSRFPQVIYKQSSFFFFPPQMYGIKSVDRQQAQDLELSGTLKPFGSSSSWENLNNHRVSLQNLFSTLCSQIKVVKKLPERFLGAILTLCPVQSSIVGLCRSPGRISNIFRSSGKALRRGFALIKQQQHQWGPTTVSFQKCCIQGHSSHRGHGGIYLC